MSIPSPVEVRGGETPLGTGRVDFGWLGQAWTLLWARPGVWITAFLLYLLIGIVLWLLWAIPSGTLAMLQQTYLSIIYHTAPPLRTQHPYQDFAQNQVFSFLLAGVNTLFYAGFYRMALRQMRGERISVAGIFSAFPLALPLLMVGIAMPVVLALLEAVLAWLLHWTLAPSIVITIVSEIVILPSLILQALVMFAPLLVVDTGANAADALLGSVRLLRGQWFLGILFYFVATLVGVAGGLVCGVGMLVSYPLFLLSIAVGYFALTQPTSNTSFEMPAPDPGVWPPPPTI
jgi:hypothetical protein